MIRMVILAAIAVLLFSAIVGAVAQNLTITITDSAGTSKTLTLFLPGGAFFAGQCIGAANFSDGCSMVVFGH